MSILRSCTAILFAMSGFSQELPKMSHVVRASGEATVSAKPDRAEINIGVVTHGPTAESSSQQNAEQTSQVMTTLKRIVASGGELKTSGYSVSPEYDYPKDGKPRLNGYQTSNTVQVTLNDLALLGPVIDKSVSSGANEITGIAFSLKDDLAIRQQALSEAAQKAKTNAEAIARALGLKVVGVLSAESSAMGGIRPLPVAFMKAEAGMARAPTPVEAGDLDIHATVTVTLEIQ